MNGKEANKLVLTNEKDKVMQWKQKETRREKERRNTSS